MVNFIYLIVIFCSSIGNVISTDNIESIDSLNNNSEILNLKYTLVNISSGTLRGTVNETWTHQKYVSFRGIPYAEPPIGELRFKAPVGIKPWQGILNATEDAKICPQENFNNFIDGPFDEDCLYLNVYTKKLNGSQPVIVFIHPGAFRFMTGASNWFGPEYLLDNDVVLVTFNYRLDALGFLSTGDNSAVGNYGMKDQVEVLRWVQRNIQFFGGDPNRVTIAGNSAGSASVFLHMLSPMSKGLFNKAIAMSGGIVGNIKWFNKKQQLMGAEKLAQLFNCSTKSTDVIIKCLRKVPANDINSKFRVQQEFKSFNILSFGPIVEFDSGNGEERFLTGDPATLIKSKLFSHVHVVTGITAHEMARRGIFIANNQTLVEKLNKDFNTLAPAMFEYEDRTPEEKQKITNSIKSFYFGSAQIDNSSSVVLGQLFSDFVINYGEYATEKLLTKFNDKPVYFYKFNYKGRYGQDFDPSTNKTIGPGHLNDLMYILSTSKLYPLFKESDPEAFMVKQQTSIWYNFATNGNPTPSHSSIQWTPATNEIKKYLYIDSSISMKDGVPFAERMKLWESIFPV